jgi:hypothetical protein
MSKAKAIEILSNIKLGYSDSPNMPTYRQIEKAIQELGEEEKDHSHITEPVPPMQEYRPKCDWCGGPLGFIAITDGKGHLFCSAECQNGVPQLDAAVRELDDPVEHINPETFGTICDWCGDVLGIAVRRSTKGHEFCSASCQMCYEDHNKLADLIAWRESFVSALRQGRGP